MLDQTTIFKKLPLRTLFCLVRAGSRRRTRAPSCKKTRGLTMQNPKKQPSHASLMMGTRLFQCYGKASLWSSCFGTRTWTRLLQLLNSGQTMFGIRIKDMCPLYELNIFSVFGCQTRKFHVQTSCGNNFNTAK